MEAFLARQPIFDQHDHVAAYEILYRDSEKNCYQAEDPDAASGRSLLRSFVDFGIQDLTANKHAFINFTDKFIKNGVATIFPSDYLVIEILESVKIDEEIVDCCRSLHDRGYHLALDDFTYSPEYEALLPAIDILKIDFRVTPPNDRANIVKKLRHPGLTFLAEKVETQKEYHEALSMGYQLFQGYYFAKPEVGRCRKITPLSESRMELIRVINQKDAPLEQIIPMIESDLSFSYQILRLVNSAYYSRREYITSIRQAVIYLGTDEIKKWLYVAAVSDIRESGVPEEICLASLLRSKFLENLALFSGHQKEAPVLLTVGMFSFLDVLLNMPMEKALKEMNFSEEIQRVLTGRNTGFLGTCLRIEELYEHCCWGMAVKLGGSVGITPEMMRRAYFDAVKWAGRMAA